MTQVRTYLAKSYYFEGVAEISSRNSNSQFSERNPVCEIVFLSDAGGKGAKKGLGLDLLGWTKSREDVGFSKTISVHVKDRRPKAVVDGYPVDPKPPSPRAVSSRSSTQIGDGVIIFSIIS